MLSLLQRTLRGIPSDVWIAESLPESDTEDYSTIELHFSRPDYHILVEEVNSLSQLPLGKDCPKLSKIAPKLLGIPLLGMRTYMTKSKHSSAKLSKIVKKKMSKILKNCPILSKTVLICPKLPPSYLEFNF